MFEESKIWLILFLTAVLISIGYGTHYLTSVDEANAALVESKSKLNDVNDQVQFRKKSWEEQEKVLSKIQAETDKHAVLLQAKDILDKRYRTVEGDLKYVTESMKTSVDATRNKASGEDLGEVTLLNGKVLRGAKVRKVDDAGISMIHADGIGTIPAELLPASLKEKYDVGPDALAPQLQEAQTAFLSKPEGDTTKTTSLVQSVTPSSKPEPSKSAAPAVDESKIKKIKLRSAELEARIAAYTTSVNQYRSSAEKHQTLAGEAKSRGQPSTRHTGNANEDLAQVATIERQLASMREELKKLAVELEYAKKGP
jgi:hypothetical protein